MKFLTLDTLQKVLVSAKSLLVTTVLTFTFAVAIRFKLRACLSRVSVQFLANIQPGLVNFNGGRGFGQKAMGSCVFGLLFEF